MLTPFAGEFFTWYNGEHRSHLIRGSASQRTCIYGRAGLVQARRGLVLDAAYAAHPEALREETTQTTRAADHRVDLQAG